MNHIKGIAGALVSTRISCAFALVLLALAFSGKQAVAQCLPGLPCVVDAMANTNHFDGRIPPNETGRNAAKAAGSGSCNADFMNQIYARAFIEAERENVMMQAIIRKPDSVLEYSCFEQFANITSTVSPTHFSESTRWSTDEGGDLATVALSGSDSDDVAQIDNEDIDDIELEVYMAQDSSGNKLPNTETRLGNNIETLVLESLLAYVDGNFPHDFLGGSPSGLNNDITGETTLTEDYDCDMMNSVWFMAKCDDFEIDDRMLSFNTLTRVDPRIYPVSCPAAATTITTDLINVANNVNNRYAEMDKISTVVDTTAGSSCGAPIPTGLVVRVYQYTTGLLGNVTTTHKDHNEHICAHPGCFFDGTKCRR